MRMLFLLFFAAGITLLHYFTPLTRPMLHDIFQRLYYIPIILAAFWFGFRGGIACALAVSIVYAPHILFQWGGHLTMELEKYLEIVLYNVVGGITGFLSQKEQAKSRQLNEIARGLEESYRQLESQSNLIIEIEGQLRKAERLSAIGELSAVLAHEIRNPLGSIQGTAEILKDDFRPGDKKHEFLDILIKESGRLNRVVEDFLRLARPQPANLGDCDVMEELHNVVTLVTTEARGRDVRLELESAALPAVRGDREKLRQAFLNLLLNALQATPPGGRVSVIGAYEKSNEMIRLEIRDTGAGIDAEALPRIFEPFFSTKEGGTGLGLAITQKIIEGHGGRIEVESERGKGALFRIVLPAKIESPRSGNGA
ncbi:MAG TPA: ATP-binding protein [Geobacteraceae bacterium]